MSHSTILPSSTFVELYAGLAAVSLRLLGVASPVSRLGCKSGYAEAIIAEMRIAAPDRIVLVDTDPGLCAYLTMLFDDELRLSAAAQIATLAETETTWRRCRDAKDGQPWLGPGVDWLVWCCGARGGVGGFKGAHIRRPNVQGFIPSLASLAKRLRNFCPLPCRVEVINATATSIVPIPNATAYLDPPYAGRQGYSSDKPSDVVAVAPKWRAAGCKVGISEAVPVIVPVTHRFVDLTARRRGQTRRSLTRNNQEWLTVLDVE